jgi:hypothetical protein
MALVDILSAGRPRSTTPLAQYRAYLKSDSRCRWSSSH